jgi:S1-C subfamily serine protease
LPGDDGSGVLGGEECHYWNGGFLYLVIIFLNQQIMKSTKLHFLSLILIATILLCSSFYVSCDNTKSITNNITDTAIINKSRKATLKILSYNENIKDSYIGTGFFIKVGSDTLIITCFHIIGTAKYNPILRKYEYAHYRHIKGIIWNGDTINLHFYPKDEITENNTGFDYSILKGEGIRKGIEMFSINKIDTTIYIGENVIFSGYPFGIEHMITHTGVVSGEGNNYGNFYIQASVSHGNSGGIIINNKGLVMGIMTWGINTSEFNNLLNSDTSEKEQIIMEDINTGIGRAINIKYLRSEFYK